MKKTIIVLGAYRGGTSMVASVLRNLGVFMGESFGKEAGGSNHEDIEFQQANPPQLRDLIAIRNEQHDVWGWKDPATIFNIRHILEDLRNPHFITIFRDPYAIATSEKKYNGRAIANGMEVAFGHNLKLYEFWNEHKWQFPNLLVSYEKAIAHPKQFITDVDECLMLDSPKDIKFIAQEGIQPERYTVI